MTTKLHHKSKRYEIQAYSETTLAWQPVGHTDNPAVALQNVQKLTVTGNKARILDRVTRTVAATAHAKNIQE